MKFRLIEAKGLSSPLSIQELEQYFDRFNKEFFNGELQKVPIRFSLSSRIGGEARATISHNTIIPKTLIISTYFKRDKEALLNILIHEMIHFAEYNDLNLAVKARPYLNIHNLWKYSQKSGINKHSQFFLHFVNRFKSLGRDIPISEMIMNPEISEEIKNKNMYLIVGRAGDAEIYAGIIPPKNKANFEWIFNRMKHDNPDRHFVIYKTQDPRLVLYKKQKFTGLRIKLFYSNEKIRDIINNAEIVMQ